MISIKNNTCHSAAPGQLNTTEGRSCFELGVCQARKTPCNGCSWKLAPGIVEGPYRRYSRRLAVRFFQMRPILFWATYLTILVAALSYAAGRYGWLS